MSTFTVTRVNTLPDTSQKSDFHSLVSTATVTVTGLVNADIDSSAAIVASKLSLGTVAQTIGMSSAAINWSQGGSLASAGTTDIGTMTGNFGSVTGTTTILNLGTVAAGATRIVKFTGILTLTHHATQLILPGGANITTAAGDTAIFTSLGSGNWQCVTYEKAAGTGLVAASQSEMEAGSSNTVGVTPGRAHYHPAVIKAWGNINGTGTPAWITSYNLDASITDNGTGDYTITFTTDFGDANYIMVSGSMASAQGANDSASPAIDGPAAKLSSGVRFRIFNSSHSPTDQAQAFIAFLGDQ